MTDNKKKLNITVKKTTSPFLFPDSNSNKEKESAIHIQTQNSIVTKVNNSESNFTNATANSDSSGRTCPVSTEPEKRKRGRPRLNKESAPSVKETRTSKAILSEQVPESLQENATTKQMARNAIKETIDNADSVTNFTKVANAANAANATNATKAANVTNATNVTNGNTKNIGYQPETHQPELESEKVLKKRGRKPKNQNLIVNMSDRVYGLNNSKNAMDLENLENLSYIVNLKITKEKVEEIIQEINEEKEQSKNIVVPVVETPMVSVPTPTMASADRAQQVSTLVTDTPLATMLGAADSITVAPEMVASTTTNIASGGGSELNRCSTCAKCPHCCNGVINSQTDVNVTNGHTQKTLQLSNYDQIDVDINELGHGYLDCYIGDLMPGFLDKDEDGSDRWPLSSKYPCRNCEEMFSTTPAGLVQKIFGDYEVDPMKCKFFLYLNFCNWACAARYAFDRMPDWVNQHNMINLCYNTIMKKVDSKHTWRKVDMAPELGNLQRNGGELSIEQYRNLTQTNITYTIYLAPLIPLRMTLEETSSASSTRAAKNRNIASNTKDKVVLLDKSRVMKAEQSIKNRKDGNKGNTIDRLMKVEIR